MLDCSVVAFAGGVLPLRIRHPHRRAFTLIELLTVIAILALLAAIGSRTLYAAKERSRIVQCRAGLACLARALADYKQTHGDYPLAAPTLEMSAAGLFTAIADDVRQGVSSLPTATLDTGHVVFVDPWGNPYAYVYRNEPGAEWRPQGFLLFSLGPDASGSGPDAAGRFESGRRAPAVNADNLYFDDPP